MAAGAGSELGSPLLAELARALQLVRQLESHLAYSSQTDSCKSLAPEILSSIRKSILMAKSSDADGGEQHDAGAGDSPRSESSSPAFKDHSQKMMIKKRKTLHKWTKQLRLTAGAGGVEGPLEDGHSWRKYGQKDILGAKHPRAYYRCTHRNTQGCPATKQVQRSDDDPLLFDITYLGTHSCLQKPQRSSVSSQLKLADSRGAKNILQQLHNPNLLSSFRAGLKVKTEGLESDEAHGQASMAVRDETPAEIFSPAFLSPVTSDSTYLSMSPYQISSFDGGMKLQTSDSDLTEIISRANSVSNSSLVDMDFMLDELDFNQDFQFDASSFFS
ncbi:hypothetical protein Cni_G04448 [Canna indica]|uniref:WRKY domain-containing protein n=1 Tax=Canna indica TaxID=4628 RepID=A0AAQ3JW03_9LILI|nr:hypothetical protein Cni_G04448 [Canna indica]